MINISKRVVSAFALLSLALGLLITRIATIETGKYAAASSQNGRKTTEIAYSRGCIYDCRMERLVNASSSRMLAAKPTAQAMSFFRESMNDAEFEAVSERFRLGYPVFVNAPGSDVLPETQDIFAYEKVNRYSAQPFLSHIIGYLDSGGVRGVSGIEKAFDSELSAASGKLSVSYRTNAFGSM
ncbi:MAG: hypothetical protein GX851_06190, partial [Clostridiales bacterium]|nr:hypothetical protein [Clostridiales bacterium]